MWWSEKTQTPPLVPAAVSGSDQHQKDNQVIQRCHPYVYTTPLRKRFFVGCGAPFMRLAEQLTFRFAHVATNHSLAGR